MTTATIYEVTAEGAHFAPAPVAVRKFPADLADTREVKFSPVAADGQTAVKVRATTVGADIIRQWLAATDGTERTALLADAEWKEHKSGNVSPTRGQVALALEFLDGPTLFGLLAEGIAIRFSSRGDDSATGKAAKAKMTEADKAAAAYALMFPAPVVTGQDIADAAATIAPTVNPTDGIAEAVAAHLAEIPPVEVAKSRKSRG